MYKNEKCQGSRAALTNGNPLAFNGARSARISQENRINEEGAFDYKLAENQPNGPNDYFEQSLIEHTAYHNATIELAKYKKVGQAVISKRFREIKAYFNGSANKIAFASLLYINYFNKKLLKKSEVSHALGITSKASYDLVNDCIAKGYAQEVEGKKFKPSALFIEAYEDYIQEELVFVSPKASTLVSFFNALTNLKNARKEYS